MTQEEVEVDVKIFVTKVFLKVPQKDLPESPRAPPKSREKDLLESHPKKLHE